MVASKGSFTWTGYIAFCFLISTFLGACEDTPSNQNKPPARAENLKDILAQLNKPPAPKSTELKTKPITPPQAPQRSNQDSQTRKGPVNKAGDLLEFGAESSVKIQLPVPELPSNQNEEASDAIEVSDSYNTQGSEYRGFILLLLDPNPELDKPFVNTLNALGKNIQSFNGVFVSAYTPRRISYSILNKIKTETGAQFPITYCPRVAKELGAINTPAFVLTDGMNRRRQIFDHAPDVQTLLNTINSY